MAETVKENGRKRRPPSHLRQGYNEDNFEPAKTYNSIRSDKSQTHTDSSSMFMMAKLLSKFLSSVNKKLNSDKKSLIEHESPPISDLPKTENSKPSRSDKILHSEKYKSTPKIDQSNKPSLNYSLIYQEKLGRGTNFTQNGFGNKNKESRGNLELPEAPQNIIMNNMMSVDSMSKMSREQFNRLIPKGINQNLKKEEIKISTGSQNSNLTSKVLQGLTKNPQSSADFKQDTKLFKRASFHVGIAYNIHIENVKQKNSSFGPEELDPTFASKRLRQDNSGFFKKQNEEIEKLRKQQDLVLKSKMDEEAAMKLLQENVTKENKDKLEIEENKRITEERMQREKINENKDLENGELADNTGNTTKPSENTEREARKCQTKSNQADNEKESCQINGNISME